MFVAIFCLQVDARQTSFQKMFKDFFFFPSKREGRVHIICPMGKSSSRQC